MLKHVNYYDILAAVILVVIVSPYLVNIIDLPSVAILSRSVSIIERHTEQQDAFIEAEAQT